MSRVGWFVFAVTSGMIAVVLLDVSGRVVRRLMSGAHPAGDYRLLWDGRDDDGREVAAGVYLTRIVMTRGVAVGRVLVAGNMVGRL
jgi:flagellar hook assembly protein FlgD